MEPWAPKSIHTKRHGWTMFATLLQIPHGRGMFVKIMEFGRGTIHV
jgi:hypothetical protein